MVALSITLPEQLALKCRGLAERLEISLSEFICIAVKREVARLEKERELKYMAKCFKAMRKNNRYIVDSNELDRGFGAHDRLLPL